MCAIFMCMPKRRTWTDEQLIEAVEKSFSMRNALAMMNLNPTGGNYKSIKSHIARLELDISHWTGQGHLKGKTHSWNSRTPSKEIFVQESKYRGSSEKLKKRLLKEFSFEYKCAECSINSWNGKKLSLQLDHINGNNIDNRLENLRFLCPNCHSLTKTFCRKKSSL